MNGLCRQFSLFTEKTHKIGVLSYTGWLGIHGRAKNKKNMSVCSDGMESILLELKCEWEYCSIDCIGRYDYILVPIMSVVDIENFLSDWAQKRPDKNGCKIIVGGMGCLNIWPIYDYIDIAVFGRAEGQINGIIGGQDYDNVWRKADDPCLKQQYKIRQPQYRLRNEVTVGCRHKCLFCQYTWIRSKQFATKRSYQPPSTMLSIEDHWNDIDWTNNKVYYALTAWDGLTENTRAKIGKNISDKGIYAKIVEASIGRKLTMKIYLVVGYPWETVGTVAKDIMGLSKLMSEIEQQLTHDVQIMFYITPFSPEPFTPMSRAKANVADKWRDIIRDISGNCVYRDGKINAWILPQINSPITLSKRVALNRCGKGNRDRVTEYVLDINKIKSTTEQIDLLNTQYHDIMELALPQTFIPVEQYLETYCKVAQIGGEA